MRSSAEVLTYIDTLITCSLEQPEMYAASPAMLEAMLMELENLAAFIRSDDDQPTCVVRSAYSEFLMSKGFGAARRFVETDSNSTRGEFQPLCDLWREYLNSRRQAR